MYNVEQNIFFNQSLDTLSHYGTPGMKWGVRNEEATRKYRGGGKDRGRRDPDAERRNRERRAEENNLRFYSKVMNDSSYTKEQREMAKQILEGIQGDRAERNKFAREDRAMHLARIDTGAGAGGMMASLVAFSGTMNPALLSPAVISAGAFTISNYAANKIEDKHAYRRSKGMSYSQPNLN